MPTITHEPQTGSVPGYDFGKPAVARSPVSLEELRHIEETIGWTEDDARVLQQYGDIFRQHAEEMVDAWRAVIASKPFLAQWFFGPDGHPDEEYKSRVKKRFVQWVLDACFRPHDQEWLDYQEEIGQRHTPDKKNKTDGARTPWFVPLRYMLAFVTTITVTSRKFFVEAGVAGDELRRLEDAWARNVQLHVTLWSRPYTIEGLW
jgi:hypothetical protein